MTWRSSGGIWQRNPRVFAPWMGNGPAVQASGGVTAGPITLNSQAENHVSVATATPGISLTLDGTAAGTSRMVFIYGVQQGSETFTSATFDVGGTDVSMSTPTNVFNSPIQIARSYLKISDVPTGAVTINFGMSGAPDAVEALILAICLNNVSGTAPTETDTAVGEGDNEPVLSLTPTALDAVLSLLGTDVASAGGSPTDGSMTEVLDLEDSNLSGGISAELSSWIGATAGEFDPGWQHTGGGTVDIAVIADLVAHL